MNGQLSDLHRAKRGTAILAACIAQTVNESDPSFQARFLDRLERAYSELREDPAYEGAQELELLSWTRELLTGFSLATGKGEPFLGG
ncbi:hypothetical protein [Methylorubrum thiocyanatum]|uniref:hypothetical protein n=1 Tax=Methylorubrum thiocyanatum TaxID=47958 RepID=UPI003F801DA1